ncbi:hypothetical protein SLNSH_07110 [Alsobacter soli]|uniref:DUF930 domain-containing protein n=1 Tax=Alsobacter soli TaxID=2109933 RepID=A0A2T1HVR0_9HYPH|nr:DUF930 domain-containing protein [Alsobacter soli]PSC05741.1 hypothetical protein SLNSH_07110 [Alsobacter soli]
MKNAVLVLAVGCALLSAGGGASARARNVRSQLLKMAPETRLEQECNERATDVLRQQHRLNGADEVVAYAFGQVSVEGSRVKAPGAAVRDHGAWYRLSYQCKAAPDGLAVEAFTYELGEAIPRSEWDAHFLTP